MTHPIGIPLFALPWEYPFDPKPALAYDTGRPFKQIYNLSRRMALIKPS